MKTNYRITDKDLFLEKIESLEIDLIGDQGDVIINDNCISGQHGFNDYEEEYGFTLELPKFMICDSTSNHGIYIGEDNDNCNLEENAKLYDSEEKAQAVIDDNNWNEWAYILEQSNTSY